MTIQAQTVEQSSGRRTALAILAGVIIVLACFAPLYVIVFTLNERRAPVLGTPTAEQNIPAEQLPGVARAGRAPAPPAAVVPRPSPRAAVPAPSPSVRPPVPAVPPAASEPSASAPPAVEPAPGSPPAAEPEPSAPTVEDAPPAAPADQREPAATDPEVPPQGAPGQPAQPEESGPQESGMAFVESMLPWLFGR